MRKKKKRERERERERRSHIHAHRTEVRKDRKKSKMKIGVGKMYVYGIVTYLSSSVMLSQAVSSSHWLGLSIWASRSSTYMYIHTTAVSVKRACVILMTTVTL